MSEPRPENAASAPASSPAPASSAAAADRIATVDDDGMVTGGPIDARVHAVQRITRRVRQYPEFEIGPLEFDDPGIDRRDAALAAAIDHAVARRWLTLEALLAPRLTRGWDRVEAKVRACLMVGAAQLLFLDRVPEHAAIHASVELAKRLVRPKAGGLVNAVLRGIARDRQERLDTFDPASRNQIPLADGGAWRMGTDIFSADPIRRTSEQTSIGMDLVARWYAAFGHAEAERLCRHALVDAPILVTGLSADIARPDDEKPILQPHAEPGFFVLDAPRETLGAVLRDHRGSRVQDPTSAEPIAATAEIRPTTILDLCAGKGTKTRQLRTLHPKSQIVATDVDDDRMEVLRAAMRQDRNTRVVEYTSLSTSGPDFDLIVLDVPCSNTGVLARRVEARYRGSDTLIDGLVSTQRQIIADAMRVLKPGGHLLYATCSVEPAENEQQLAWMQKWHPLEVVRSGWKLPSGLPGESPTDYRDGGGHALLHHTGG
ncbi:MAG: transcription antitermination factor NusB [Phycisphaerales bacterium]